MTENEVGKIISPDALGSEKFFESIRLRMIAVARKRIQGDASQDVVQEAMMILNSKLDQVKDEKEVLPFAFQILRNCIGNYYNKVRREQRIIEFSDSAEQAGIVDENSDWLEILTKAISHLRVDSPRCAQLFEALLGSAEIEDLRKLLDLTADNVYRTLYRCRNRLKKILTEEMRIHLS